MRGSICRRAFFAACGLALLTLARPCHAHFLWLKTIDDGGQSRAFLFFGESATDEAYHLPENLATTKVWRRTADGKRAELATENLDTDDRIGLVAPLGGDGPCVLEAAQQYGIYGQSLLRYYAKHVDAGGGKELNAAGPSQELQLDIVPRAEGEQVELTVSWDGKPLAGATVTVAVDDAEAVEQKTDEEGRLRFKPGGEGLVGVLANHLEKDNVGKLDGKDFKGVLHYASLTFEWKGPRTDAAAAGAKPQADMASLPEPVSSFGAAVADGWLYVYGGHTGTEHDHSAANLSKHFRRIKLDGGGEWEELSMQTPLQGLPLVAHGGKVYRIGGLSARNPTTKEQEDLHSTAEFAEFDPATGVWRMLAPLPAARSSHNAVVIGDRVYVIGGWRLEGKAPGEWQPDALVYDFAKPRAGWQTLPEPSFKRRALAAGEWHGKLVALGGMDETAKPSQRVDFFDPNTGSWSQGPDIPGAGMAGFGVSAWNLDGNLYVSGFRGIVYRLNDTGSAWEEAARLDTPRFFHQLVPATGGGLLAVGGASRKGHLADIEWIDIHGARSL